MKFKNKTLEEYIEKTKKIHCFFFLENEKQKLGKMGNEEKYCQKNEKGKKKLTRN